VRQHQRKSIETFSFNTLHLGIVPARRWNMAGMLKEPNTETQKPLRRAAPTNTGSRRVRDTKENQMSRSEAYSRSRRELEAMTGAVMLKQRLYQKLQAS
jgi:hypothetical protein